MRRRVVAALMIGVVGAARHEPKESLPATGPSTVPSATAGGESSGELSGFQQGNGIGPVKEKLQLAPVDEALVDKGRQLFKTMCAACHKLDERYVGPARGAQAADTRVHDEHDAQPGRDGPEAHGHKGGVRGVFGPNAIPERDDGRGSGDPGILADIGEGVTGGGWNHEPAAV